YRVFWGLAHRFQWSWQEHSCPYPHQATASANQMLTHKTSPSAADHRMAFQSARQDSWSLPPSHRILAYASPSATERYDGRGPVYSSTSKSNGARPNRHQETFISALRTSPPRASASPPAKRLPCVPDRDERQPHLRHAQVTVNCTGDDHHSNRH